MMPLGKPAELLPAAKLKPEPRPPNTPPPKPDLAFVESATEKPNRCPTTLPADAAASAAFPSPSCRGVGSALLSASLPAAVLPKANGCGVPDGKPVVERDTFGADPLLDPKAKAEGADVSDLLTARCFGESLSPAADADFAEDSEGWGLAAASGTSPAMEGLREEPLEDALEAGPYDRGPAVDAPASGTDAPGMPGASGCFGVPTPPLCMRISKPFLTGTITQVSTGITCAVADCMTSHASHAAQLLM